MSESVPTYNLTVPFTWNHVTPPSETILDPLSQWEIVVQTGSLVVICTVALIGNFLVAFTLFRKNQLITPSNRLVFSLTASNFLFALLVLPFVAASSAQQTWQFGIFWCNFSAFVTMLVATASVLTLGIIAIDRYYAIVKPMVYTLTITNSRSILMLMGIWAHAFVCALSPLFGWSRFQYQEEKAACLVDWHHNIFYSTFVLVTSILLPFVTMLVCYYFILQVARAKCRKIHVGTLSEGTDGGPSQLLPSTTAGNIRNSLRGLPRKPSWILISYTSPIKGFRTICVVVGAFVASFLPYTSLAVAETIEGIEVAPKRLQIVVLWLAFAAAMGHPIVYGLYNRSIRKEMKACLRPPSNYATRGLPRTSSRRHSASGSLLDYSPFRHWRGSQSRRASVDGSHYSIEPSSQFLSSAMNLRKASQDSGAIMTDSDLETERTFLSLYRWKRRVSAPSRLQHFTARFSKTRENIVPTVDLQTLPILRSITAGLNESENTVDLISNPHVPAEDRTCDVPYENTGEIPTVDGYVSNAESRLISEQLFPVIADEGIEKDCKLEDIE